MTEGDNDEQILEQFRQWLQETRREAAQSGELEGPLTPPDSAIGLNAERNSTPQAMERGPVPPAEPRIGLNRLAEEFTALRHELKLQTRSSRTLEERLEAALTLLGEAAATFRSAAAREASAALATDKGLASALAELDEALDRGRDQWEKSAVRLIGPPSSDMLARLEEAFTTQWWWQRRRTRVHHRRVCRLIEQMEDQARGDREALFGALLTGYALIQQRLARNMVNCGVNRIRTVGRTVDPEQMIVIEVVDAEGPAGQVVEEIRRGYTWNNQVLRPAEVRAIRPRFDLEKSEIEPPTAVSE